MQAKLLLTKNEVRDAGCRCLVQGKLRLSQRTYRHKHTVGLCSLLHQAKMLQVQGHSFQAVPPQHLHVQYSIASVLEI